MPTTIDIHPGLTALVAPILAGPEGALVRARAAVLSLLRAATGRPDATIAHSPDGAPRCPELPGLHISVSHSRSHAAIALCTYSPVGIDIEDPRPRQLAAVASRTFTPAQLHGIDTLPGTLLQGWTIKEAAYKAALLPHIADLRAIDYDIHARTASLGHLHMHIAHTAPLGAGPADTDPWITIVVRNPRTASA